MAAHAPAKPFLSKRQLERLVRAGREDLVREYRESLDPLDFIELRPDSPADWDEQTGFVESSVKFAVLLGGTGAGKTFAAAVKTARFVLETPPPRAACPFWVLGETKEQCMKVCWVEKLSKLIPPDRIKAIRWHDRMQQWPAAVRLKHPDGGRQSGWILEFKSYAQGRHVMQGQSIGGYWFNEEVPMSLVEEVQGRCRDYDSPGWADFTPIDIVSPEWPEYYDDPPEGWRFFHVNSVKNTALAPGWVERYLKTIPVDMRETRKIGVFSTFRGQVFKEWRRNVHVIDEFPIPQSWHRVRGIDFGFNNPFCCLWVGRDRDGRYFVYDEHFEAGQLHSHHVDIIKKKHPWNENLTATGPTYSDHDSQERAEMAKLGVRCTPANKSTPRNRAARLRSLMMIQGDGRPRLYVFKKCENLIREIRTYKWPEGTDNRNPADNPIDKDNHAVDAMGYAIYSDLVGVGRAPQPVKREWQQREGLQLQRRR